MALAEPSHRAAAAEARLPRLVRELRQPARRRSRRRTSTRLLRASGVSPLRLRRTPKVFALTADPDTGTSRGFDIDGFLGSPPAAAREIALRQPTVWSFLETRSGMPDISARKAG